MKKNYSKKRRERGRVRAPPVPRPGRGPRRPRLLLRVRRGLPQPVAVRRGQPGEAQDGLQGIREIGRFRTNFEIGKTHVL